MKHFQNWYKAYVPDRKNAFAWIQSFLEPVYRRREMRGPDPPCFGVKRVGTQQRWGKHEERFGT
jgi:hypothetical protein